MAGATRASSAATSRRLRSTITSRPDAASSWRMRGRWRRRNELTHAMNGQLIRSSYTPSSGRLLPPEAQPSANDAPQAGHRREIEEDRCIRRREAFLEHAELHPIDHPTSAGHQLTMGVAPLLWGRLDPDAFDFPPVMAVDVDHRQLEQPTEPARQRRLARPAAADHRDPLHLFERTPGTGRQVAGVRPRRASCLTGTYGPPNNSVPLAGRSPACPARTRAPARVGTGARSATDRYVRPERIRRFHR